MIGDGLESQKMLDNPQTLFRYSNHGFGGRKCLNFEKRNYITTQTLNPKKLVFGSRPKTNFKNSTGIYVISLVLIRIVS